MFSDRFFLHFLFCLVFSGMCFGNRASTRMGSPAPYLHDYIPSTHPTSITGGGGGVGKRGGQMKCGNFPSLLLFWAFLPTAAILHNFAHTPFCCFSPLCLQFHFATGQFDSSSQRSNKRLRNRSLFFSFLWFATYFPISIHIGINSKLSSKALPDYEWAHNKLGEGLLGLPEFTLR